MKRSLTIKKPFDMHLHVRDGAALYSNLKDCTDRFAGAIIMPNLNPPVTNAKIAEEYHSRIMSECSDPSFLAMMALYLTDNTSEQDVLDAVANDNIYAFKLYPAGATTNSDFGVTNIENCKDALAIMSEHGLPLLVHGEVTDTSVDIFDREKAFIDTVLLKLRNERASVNIKIDLAAPFLVVTP